MTLGLPRTTVTIAPYDPLWPDYFAKEKQLLLATLGDKLIAVEHIGSTAVPGLAAKPIIDMVAAIASFNELAFFIEHLQKLGYEYMPDRMFASRKFFPKGPRTHRTHHINLVIKDDPEQWEAAILFRDYLKQNNTARDQYAQLKQALAKAHPNNRAAYTAAKNDFIQQCLRECGAKN